MSIATRIEAIEEHISDTYDMLERGGTDLTNLDKNIINISSKIRERYLDFMNNGTDVIWNNWEKVLASDVTETSMQNTIQAPMKSVLKGNTSQEGTPTPDSPQDIEVVTGENSVKIQSKNWWGNLESAVTRDVNNVQFTNNADGSILVDGTASSNAYSLNGTLARNNNHYITLPAGTYTISGGTTTCRLQVYDTNDNSIANQGSPTFTLTQPTNLFIRVEILNGNTANNILIKPMLEKGSSSTSYVPHEEQNYTINLGNEELAKIGTYQDKLLKTNGKNLIGLDTAQYKVDLKAGDVIILKNTTSTGMNLSLFSNYGDSSRYDFWSVGANGTRTVTITQNTGAIAWTTNVSNDGYAWVNKGSTALSYEPYGTGDWYKREEIRKRILNGTEGWQLRNTSAKGTKTYSLAEPFNYLLERYSTDPGGYAYCDKFIVNHTIEGNAEMYMTGYLLDIICMTFYFNRNNTSRAMYINTTEDLPTYLAQNKATLYYILEVPTYTKITDTTLINQLNELEDKLKSYDNETNISQNNAELPFYLDLTALKNV